MLSAAIGDLDVQPENCMMVGDRLHTDIQMAIRTGMFSAMPLTGENTMEDAQALPVEDQPTFVLDRVDRLVPEALWKELGWTEENDPID